MRKAKCAEKSDVVASEFITFEDLGLSQEVVIKLAYLCGFRKLPFPDGINVLLKEVSEPSACKSRSSQAKSGKPKAASKLNRKCNRGKRL